MYSLKITDIFVYLLIFMVICDKIADEFNYHSDRGVCPMKISWRRLVSSALVFCLTLSLCIFVTPIKSAAADTLTSTVNIATANKNQVGAGYNWQNRYDILTLNGLNIDTEDDYGLRLPKNCTVILEGKNYIKAAKYGISCAGTVIFKGTGSLTIEAGEIGFYLISQDNTQKIRLLEGKYEITAGEYGIYSDASDFSFVGSSMKINMTSPDAPAISGRCVNLLGGSFTANAPIVTSHELVVEGLNIDVTTSSTALSSKNLSMKYLSSDYNGEASFSAKSTAPRHRNSAIFGDSVPGWVDYILLGVLAIGVAAGIFGPAMRRKKKDKELHERLRKEGYEN